MGGNKTKASKQVLLFGAMCCAAYFASYITRHNMAAAIAEMVVALDVAKEIIGLSVTAGFMTYGIGQIISGILGDKIKPRILIAVGLAGTALCNLTVSAVSNVYLMIGVWSLNGFFQSFLWPPLVRAMVDHLEGDDYSTVASGVTVSANVGTIFTYVLTALCVKLFSWRMSFAFSALWALATGIIWFVLYPRFDSMMKRSEEKNEKNEKKEKKGGFVKFIFTSGIALLAPVIIIQGALRDGVTTWLPTYINEVFGIDTSSSILTASILPIFAIISITLTEKLRKKIGSETKTAFILFIPSFLSALVLSFIYSGSAVASVALMALLTGCMHGVNQLLICVLPSRFKESGNISTISGVLNSFTYIGSALSAYGFAFFSTLFGWGGTVLLWAGLIICGALIMAVFLKKHK
ncbi:MAG: MFS transporter [Ruminococcaceae bacterium]|nr:MFS transporter [Oscillospiraceae bacterium]